MIGKKGEHETEMQSILLDKGIVYNFPPEVDKEAERVASDFRKISSSLSTDISLLGNSSARLVNLRKARSEENFSAFTIIAVEQNKKAVNYTKIRDRGKVDNMALVFGNEVDGLSKEDLKLCDLIAKVPMYGKKESLNVSVCAGVVLYSLIINSIHD